MVSGNELWRWAGPRTGGGDRVRQNTQALGSDRRRSPPREGPALLQDLVVCGRCGLRMTVRYNMHRGVQVPT